MSLDFFNVVLFGKVKSINLLDYNKLSFYILIFRMIIKIKNIKCYNYNFSKVDKIEF